MRYLLFILVSAQAFAVENCMNSWTVDKTKAFISGDSSVDVSSTPCKGHPCVCADSAKFGAIKLAFAKLVDAGDKSGDFILAIDPGKKATYDAGVVAAKAQDDAIAAQKVLLQQKLKDGTASDADKAAAIKLILDKM